MRGQSLHNLLKHYIGPSPVAAFSFKQAFA
jgi:hypothetical protein